MTAFSDATAALFADADMAQAATWQAAAGGAVIACRVIAARPDTATPWAEARVVSRTLRIDVQAAEIATVARGDRFVIGGDTFVVQGEPQRDFLRLVWSCEAVPE